MSDQNYFEQLSAVNVSGKTEKKNGLTYLSWAWAWSELKKRFPDATYTVYEDEQGRFYHTDGKTCWVKTGVTVNGIEHIEYLPVMDRRNGSIAAEAVSSVDVNKSIQRSLTKAVARHGLGLYIYAGEDLPADTPIEQGTDLISTEQATKLKRRVMKIAGDVDEAVERFEELTGHKLDDLPNMQVREWDYLMSSLEKRLADEAPVS